MLVEHDRVEADFFGVHVFVEVLVIEPRSDLRVIEASWGRRKNCGF